MINNKRSYTEYNITSPTTDFAIGFENYGVGAKDIIEVTLNGVLVESLGHTVRLKNAQVLEVTPAIEAGTVRLQRVTGIDNSFHKFTAGALFTAKSMDENFEQIRHSQQEVKDGFLQAVLKQAAQFSEYKQTTTAQVNTSLTAVNQAVQAFSGRVGVLEGSVTGIIRDLYQFGDKAAQYTKDAVKAAITNAQANTGFITIDSFEQGATLTQRNQALRHAADGRLYRWAGDLPKVVPDSSTPENSGGFGANAWLEVSDTTLRQDILNNKFSNDPLSREGVKGDGVYRNIADLWTVGTESYRFPNRVEAEKYLGFNISVELVDVGLNSTVDTAYLQKYMIEASAKYVATGIPQTIKLKDSACYLITGLQYYCGVNLISDGQTTFKKRPALNITSEATLKWWRIINCKASTFTSEIATKHRCRIQGIKFDGNYPNMNWTYNTYNQEQGSSLLISSSNGSNAATRAKFDLQDLVFIDTTSDGLHIVQNADVTFKNLEARNCFRGGLVITGGNTIVNGDGMIANNARADIEIDSAGFGAAGVKGQVYVNVSNYYQDVGGKIGDFVGGCDLGGSDNSEFYFDNFHVMSAPTNIFTGASANSKTKYFKITNSTLTLGVGGSAANRIINPSAMLFENVNFRLLDNGYMSVLTNFNGYIANEDYVFKNCSAEQIGTVVATSIFKIESQTTTSKANLVLSGGDYTKAPTAYLVGHILGGKSVIDNVAHAATTGVVYRRVTTGYDSDVTFKRINNNGNAVNLYVPESPLQLTSLTKFDSECRISNSLNNNTSNSVGLLQNNRTVYSDNPPTATTRSFVGDRFVLNKPVVGYPCEWVATTTSNAVSKFNATRWLVGSFATEALPVLTAFDVSTQNIDTTLNKVVTWTGTAWV